VHRQLNILTALVIAISAAPARAADLSAVDRTIRKESSYAGKPLYCLLLFGPGFHVSRESHFTQRR
jgi:hypothetical protein